MNYFELHIGDYDSATAHLSVLEDGIYGRLLRVYYRTEAPLPADHKQVCRLVRALSKPERDTVAAMLAEFFELREDGWHNVRGDEEIARFQDKQRKAKASADARWSAHRPQSEGNANASADAMRTHCEGNAPRARPQSPDTKPSSEAKLPHEHTPRQGSSTVSVDALAAEGVKPDHARDWLAVRKAKRLPLTSSSWERTKREAAKAGLSPAEAVQRCAEKGWAGFGADWEPALVGADIFAGAR